MLLPTYNSVVSYINRGRYTIGVPCISTTDTVPESQMRTTGIKGTKSLLSSSTGSGVGREKGGKNG